MYISGWPWTHDPLASASPALTITGGLILTTFIVKRDWDVVKYVPKAKDFYEQRSLQRLPSMCWFLCALSSTCGRTWELWNKEYHHRLWSIYAQTLTEQGSPLYNFTQQCLTQGMYVPCIHEEGGIREEENKYGHSEDVELELWRTYREAEGGGQRKGVPEETAWRSRVRLDATDEGYGWEIEIINEVPSYVVTLSRGNLGQAKGTMFVLKQCYVCETISFFRRGWP